MKDNSEQTKTEYTYLNKILANRGILQRIGLAMTGTMFLTKAMNTQLQTAISEETEANNRIEELKTNISGDLNKRATTFGDNKWHSLKSALDNPRNKFVIQTLSDYKSKFTSTEKLGTSNGLLAYQEVIQCHISLVKAANKKDLIKENIKKVIDDYLIANKKNNDPTHKAKKQVMNAIRAYVDKPTKDNWVALEAATNLPANQGWDKGVFSKVSRVHEEVATLKMQNKL
jgi:hypothetical protein